MIFLIELAEQLHLDRSSIRKSLKKKGIPMHKIPRATATGVQPCLAVSEADANAIILYYETARAKLKPREVVSSITSGRDGGRFRSETLPVARDESI